jgi:hypothetical protein
MRKLLIFTFLLLSSMSLAIAQIDEESEESCLHQGYRHGNGDGVDEISEFCVALIKERSQLEARQKSADGDSEFYGYKNIILIQKKSSGGRSLFLAGLSTYLKEVLALSLDEKNNELVAMDKFGGVFYFSLKYSGNVAPMRVLTNKELKGADDIVVNPSSNEISIKNLSQKKVFVFSRLDNSHGRKDQKKRGLIRTLSNTAEFSKVPKN